MDRVKGPHSVWKDVQTELRGWGPKTDTSLKHPHGKIVSYDVPSAREPKGFVR